MDYPDVHWWYSENQKSSKRHLKLQKRLQTAERWTVESEARFERSEKARKKWKQDRKYTENCGKEMSEKAVCRQEEVEKVEKFATSEKL